MTCSANRHSCNFALFLEAMNVTASKIESLCHFFDFSSDRSDCHQYSRRQQSVDWSERCPCRFRQAPWMTGGGQDRNRQLKSSGDSRSANQRLVDLFSSFIVGGFAPKCKFQEPRIEGLEIEDLTIGRFCRP
jgi:hypothetical protein